jgi:hypothetical protein
MSQSKKTPKTIEDVAKPGKSAPSLTSRPVIITNRDMMKDPMMVAETKDEGDEKASGSTVETTSGVKPSAPSLPKGERVVIPLSEKAEVAEKDSETSKDPEPVASSAEDTAAEDTTDETESTATTDDVAAAIDEAPLESDEAPVAPEATPAPKTTPEPTQDEPQPDEADSQTEPTDKDAAPTDAQIEAAAMAETAHDASVQKLIDSKKYYLPVNSVEKRRTQRFVILGIILSILLVVAWADIALDAGLIQISGVKPVTHFFSN